MPHACIPFLIFFLLVEVACIPFSPGARTQPRHLPTHFSVPSSAAIIPLPIPARMLCLLLFLLSTGSLPVSHKCFNLPNLLSAAPTSYIFAVSFPLNLCSSDLSLHSRKAHCLSLQALSIPTLGGSKQPIRRLPWSPVTTRFGASVAVGKTLRRFPLPFTRNRLLVLPSSPSVSCPEAQAFTNHL